MAGLSSRRVPGALRRLRDDLAPVDWVHVAFYAFVLATCLLRLPALPHPLRPLAWYSTALLGTLALARALRGHGGTGATSLRAAFALLVAPVSFLLLADVVPYANPWHGEHLLRALDNLLFLGTNPNEALDALAWPPLTELLQWNYAFYFFIPLMLFACLLAVRNGDGIARCLFLVLLCLYGSYVGYFVLPATGPNLNLFGLYPAHFTDPLPGLFAAERIRESLLEAELIKHNCWPSGHTALSWTCLMLTLREHGRSAFLLLLLPVVALIFSTMYLRYHYVVDVLCGFGLAWAVLRLGPGLYARLRRDPLDPPPLLGPAPARP